MGGSYKTLLIAIDRVLTSAENFCFETWRRGDVRMVSHARRKTPYSYSIQYDWTEFLIGDQLYLQTVHVQTR